MLSEVRLMSVMKGFQRPDEGQKMGAIGEVLKIVQK